MEQRIQVLRDQINELEELLDAEKKKKENLQQEYESLYQDHESLKEEYKNLDEKSKSKFIEVRQEYEGKNRDLLAQIESLRKEVNHLREYKDKTGDVNARVEAISEQYEDRLQQLTLELEALRKENEDLQQEREARASPGRQEPDENYISIEEFHGLQLEYKKIENNLEAEKKLTAALKDKLREKSNELDKLRSKNQEESQLAFVVQCENKITLMATEIERLRLTISEKEEEVSNLNRKLVESESARSLQIAGIQGNALRLAVV